MQPIGLTFKHEGAGKQGELMLIHQCGTCGKLSINRIARDDDEQAILAVFEASLQSQLADLMAKNEITILSATDRPEVYRQLFGDSVLPPL